MAIDLQLNSENDLDLQNFDLYFTIDNVDFVRQKIKIRLQFFKGEYFLNLDSGVPYYQRILGKQIVVDDAISILKAEIVNTPGVNELLEFSPNLDGPTRILSIDFKIRTDQNEIIQITEEF
jgi:hypothetical protein